MVFVVLVVLWPYVRRDAMLCSEFRSWTIVVMWMLRFSAGLGHPSLPDSRLAIRAVPKRDSFCVVLIRRHCEGVRSEVVRNAEATSRESVQAGRTYDRWRGTHWQMYSPAHRHRWTMLRRVVPVLQPWQNAPAPFPIPNGICHHQNLAINKKKIQ